MTNTKQAKNYEDMSNEERAQVIYDTLLQDDSETLSDLLLELSVDFGNDEILTVDDWLDYYKENGNMATLVRIAQGSKNLDIDDEYIRESIYYYGYKTSDSVLDLVNKDEAIEWIASALYDNSPITEEYATAWLYQD